MKISDQSTRDQILATSSPILTLLITVSVITTLVFIVFLSWVRFRKVNRGKQHPSSYGELQEEYISDLTLVEERFDSVEDDASIGDKSHESNSVSPSEVIVPEAVIVGLQRVQRCDGLDASVLKSNRRISGCYSGHNPSKDSTLSMEALIASHTRQMEQRDRFIFDPQNVGLRHLALDHLKTQQIYEKQIMAVKSRAVIII
jgi:hypothetical protein